MPKTPKTRYTSRPAITIREFSWPSFGQTRMNSLCRDGSGMFYPATALLPAHVTTWCLAARHALLGLTTPNFLPAFTEMY